MKKIYRILLMACFASLFNWATAQTTVTIKPAKDNTIYESVSGGLSNGAGNDILTGKTNQGLIRRGLIQFDLSEIPTNAVIESVTLNMQIDRLRNGNRVNALHAVTQDWGEGNSNANNGQGATAQNGDATWVHTFSPNANWNSVGGDYVGSASAAVTISNSGGIWSSEQMVIDVQNWVSNPNSNFGWIIIGDESENKSTVHFQSKESNNAPTLTVVYSAEEAATANVQIIHNAADPAAALVDVYINGGLALDDFEFRKATPFLELTANEEIQVSIAPSNSSSVADAIATFPFTLEADETYIIMASGVLDPSQFDQSVNENIAFDLFVLNPARQTAVSGAIAIDLTSFHGATDAPVVDVVAPGLGNITLIDDLTYGAFTEYASIPFVLNTPIDLNVVTDETQDLVGTFRQNLFDFAGQAITIFASGFLNPENNQNGEALGIFIATPSGVVLETENITTSVRSIEPLEGISIFPNPAKSFITITGSDLVQEKIFVEVFDLQGKLIKTKQINLVNGNFNESLDLADLAAAAYTVRVKQGKKISVTKIVKQ